MDNVKSDVKELMTNLQAFSQTSKDQVQSLRHVVDRTYDLIVDSRYKVGFAFVFLKLFLLFESFSMLMDYLSIDHLGNDLFHPSTILAPYFHPGRYPVDRISICHLQQGRHRGGTSSLHL